jgi:hypothetical protein
MQVAEKPKLKLTDLTFDQMAVFRHKATEQIKAAEEVVSALKAKREKIDVEFLRRFNEQGIQNVKTAHGTPHIIKRESYSVGNKDAFMDWVKETGALDFLEVRAAKNMVEVYKEEHEELPPGINYSAKLSIGVTKG